MSLNTDFVDASERLIRKYGMYRLTASLASLFAILAAIGLLTNLAVAGAVVSIAIFAWLLLVVLALFIDRRSMYRRISMQKEILTRYSRNIDSLQNADYFKIRNWDERVHVAPSGTAEILRKFELEVGRQSMPAFWSSVVIDPAPDSARYQKRVVVNAGTLSEEGDQNVSIPHTSRWEGHKLVVYLHFLQAESPGAIVRAYMRVQWPGYFSALHDGLTVPNEYTFTRHVTKFKTVVVLHRKFLSGHSIAVQRLHAGSDPIVTQNESRDWIVTYEADAPPIGSTLGYNLGLRDRQY